jgi:Trk-type K+ transport system membrane component
MGFSLLQVLEMCVTFGLAFWFVGFCMLLVAVRKARSEFRNKGYLRPPSGTEWFRFLLWKHYEHFDNPSTRFFFGITHFCMVGAIIVGTAIVVLVGSEVLLRGMSGFPGGFAGWQSLSPGK